MQKTANGFFNPVTGKVEFRDMTDDRIKAVWDPVRGVWERGSFSQILEPIPEIAAPDLSRYGLRAMADGTYITVDSRYENYRQGETVGIFREDSITVNGEKSSSISFKREVLEKIMQDFPDKLNVPLNLSVLTNVTAEDMTVFSNLNPLESEEAIGIDFSENDFDLFSPTEGQVKYSSKASNGQLVSLVLPNELLYILAGNESVRIVEKNEAVSRGEKIMDASGRSSKTYPPRRVCIAKSDLVLCQSE